MTPTLTKLTPRKWSVTGPSGEETIHPTKRAALEAIASRATAPEPNPVKRAMRRYNGPELARKLGVTHQSVYRYASGQRPISGPVRALLQVIMAEEEEK